MAMRMKMWLTGLMMGIATVLVCGCEGGDSLINATAVQLETALISIMNVLVSTLVYNAFDIPLT